MIHEKSDDAVSPVIGVMLMLVITIVIAGVIAAFGTGMVGNTEAAPNVVLDVQILEYYQALPDCGGPDFHIRHVSGDALDTDEIEIRMSWSEDVDGDGTYTDHYSTYSAAAFKDKYPNYFNSPVGIGGGIRGQPMYVKVEEVDTNFGEYKYGTAVTTVGGTHDYYFGDAVLTPGMRLTASADMLIRDSQYVRDIDCAGSPFMDLIFYGDVLTTNVVDDPGVMKFLLEGTPVDITILHIPSNTIIFEKEVIVQ